MEIEIKKIRVQKRIRKEMGDIDLLIQSIKKYGLLNPIVINSKYILLAGYRRLYAVKKLKWKTINAKIINAKTKLDKLNIELEENVTRKDFTNEELKRGFKLKAELIKIDNMPVVLKILYKFYKLIERFICKLFNIKGE